MRSLGKFLHPKKNPRAICTDTSLKSFQACEELNWNHERSTPHRSTTHEFAERAVRRVKEGTSSVLVQSGLQQSWWAGAMEFHFYLRNVQDPLADGKTFHARWFNSPLDGPIISFGAEVKFHSFSAKDQGRVHQLGTKILPAMIKGYAMNSERSWTGDLAHTEDPTTMPPSEFHVKKMHIKRGGH